MNRKVKVLLIISALGSGGAERVLTYIANNLKKERYEISLILYEKNGVYLKELPDNIQIYDFEKQNSLDFLRLILLTRGVIKNAKPDIILSFLFYTNIITGLAALFLKNKFKMNFVECSYPPEELSRVHLGWLKKWLVKFTYPRADVVIPNSNLTKIALEKYFGVCSENIKTICNPIDLEKVIGMSKEEVVHPFFEDKSAQIVISVGRLAEPKRFDRLLRVFSRVKKLKPNVYLIIVGEGKLGSELSEMAKKLNIDGSVDFVGFKKNPFAWISKADIFVLSSDYEGFPNVLQESMACGTPIISTDCRSGPNELITNNENGLLVPTLDEEEMVAAINRLLGNEEMMKKFSHEGVKRVEEYSKDKIIAQYEDLFVSQSSSIR